MKITLHQFITENLLTKKNKEKIDPLNQKV